MCTACAPHVHRMCIACAPHVHRTCTARAPHVHRRRVSSCLSRSAFAPLSCCPAGRSAAPLQPLCTPTHRQRRRAVRQRRVACQRRAVLRRRESARRRVVRRQKRPLLPSGCGGCSPPSCARASGRVQSGRRAGRRSMVTRPPVGSARVWLLRRLRPGAWRLSTLRETHSTAPLSAQLLPRVPPTSDATPFDPPGGALHGRRARGRGAFRRRRQRRRA